MTFIFDVLLVLIYVLLGASCIGDAVESYNEKRYFLFGLRIMATICTIIGLLQIAL